MAPTALCSWPRLPRSNFSLISSAIRNGEVIFNSKGLSILGDKGDALADTGPCGRGGCMLGGIRSGEGRCSKGNDLWRDNLKLRKLNTYCVDQKKHTKLILDSKLAPCYLGDEE